MKERYLEITYHRGRLLAAYLYLPRREGDRSAEVKEFPGGIVIDLAPDGRPIGVELTSPGDVTLERLNDALAHYGLPTLPEEEFTPLRHAA